MSQKAFTLIANARAFTLIELLIVIVIITVLALTAMFQFSNNPILKAQDAERKSEINTIADNYFQNAITGGIYAPLPDKVPTPPEGGTYQGLLSTSSDSFKICAVMSKGKDINCLENSGNPNCYCRSSHTDNGAGNGGFNNGGGNGNPNQPTPSPQSTSTPTATPAPTATPLPNIVPGYANDQSKFFQTYAVYFFDHPGFPPSGAGWNAHISLNQDFSGDYTQTYRMFGIPSHYSQDAPLNQSYAALRSITNKYVGFASTPAGIGPYTAANCGKTLYWRIANYYNPNATDKKEGPTYTATFDCTTKVGMVDPPLSWYSVLDMLTYQQKYYAPTWDFDQNGVINFTDYWLGAFSTKTRYGGWAPPE